MTIYIMEVDVPCDTICWSINGKPGGFEGNLVVDLLNLFTKVVSEKADLASLMNQYQHVFGAKAQLHQKWVLEESVLWTYRAALPWKQFVLPSHKSTCTNEPCKRWKKLVYFWEMPLLRAARVVSTGNAVKDMTHFSQPFCKVGGAVACEKM